MPRYAPPPQAVAPIDKLVPPLPPSPIVQSLRTDWRWAAISEFLWTFSDAFGYVDFDIETLERDFDGDEKQVLPDLLSKLLFALTYNRQINKDNVFDNLRKTYTKRAPEKNVLGTPEEPVQWEALGLGQKVQIIHELCEWQMENPARFRALLKTEDEAVSWRIDPVGWDKTGNTYYLFDDNRLWVQRVPHQPPRRSKKTSLTAKRAERALRRSKPKPKRSHQKKTPSKPLPPPPPKVEEPVSGSRRRMQVSFYGNPTPTALALKRGNSTPVAPTSRGTRSSARVNSSNGSARRAPPSATSTPSKVKDTPPRPLGTRISSRLRHSEDDAEWQQIPDDWLEQPRANGKANKDDDEESELSELTDEEEHHAELVELSRLGLDVEVTPPLEDESEDEQVKEEEDDEEEAEDDEEESEEEEDEDEVKLAARKALEIPEGFIEWEAVCVTLYDWRTFPQQFANSRDADEKAMYKILTKEVGPPIIDALIAKEHERIKQEAVMNRKRSSRIVARELEREAAILREQAEKEMEGRMEQQRLEEAAQAKAEAELAAQEAAREERLNERRERLAAREAAAARRLEDIEQGRSTTPVETASRKRRRPSSRRTSSPPPASVAATEQDEAEENGSSDRWELACEVCRKHGWNVDEDLDLVCCDDCSRWQHTECHDRLDASLGKKPRNWDKVDFKCQDCLGRAAKRQRKEAKPHPHEQSQAQPRARAPAPVSAPAPAPVPAPTKQHAAPAPHGQPPPPPVSHPHSGQYPNGNGPLPLHPGHGPYRANGSPAAARQQGAHSQAPAQGQAQARSHGHPQHQQQPRLPPILSPTHQHAPLQDPRARVPHEYPAHYANGHQQGYPQHVQHASQYGHPGHSGQQQLPPIAQYAHGYPQRDQHAQHPGQHVYPLHPQAPRAHPSQPQHPHARSPQAPVQHLAHPQYQQQQQHHAHAHSHAHSQSQSQSPRGAHPPQPPRQAYPSYPPQGHPSQQPPHWQGPPRQQAPPSGSPPQPRQLSHSPVSQTHPLRPVEQSPVQPRHQAVAPTPSPQQAQ